MNTFAERVAFHLIEMHDDIPAIGRSFPDNQDRHWHLHAYDPVLLDVRHRRYHPFTSWEYDEHLLEDLLEAYEEIIPLP